MPNNLKKYEVQLKSVETQKAITKGGKAFACVAGSPKLLDVYDSSGDVLANPINISNGRVTFYTVDTIDAADVIFYTDAGYAGFMDHVTPGYVEYGIVEGNLNQTVIVPFSFDTQTTIATAFDCGIDEIAGVNYNIALGGIRVTAIDATETIDFGTTGDTDGYLAAAPLGTLGSVAAVPFGATAGTIGAYGTNTVSSETRNGTRIGVAGQSFFYNLSSGSDTGEGYIFLPSTLPFSNFI